VVLRATYNVHLGLIGKRVVDFLLVSIELFSLRAKRDQESVISFQRGHFVPQFQVQGVTFHQSLLHG